MGSPSVEKFKLLVTGLKQACHEVQFFSRPNYKKGQTGVFLHTEAAIRIHGVLCSPFSGQRCSLIVWGTGAVLHWDHGPASLVPVCSPEKEVFHRGAVFWVSGVSS